MKRASIFKIYKNTKGKPKNTDIRTDKSMHRNHITTAFYYSSKCISGLYTFYKFIPDFLLGTPSFGVRHKYNRNRFRIGNV